MTLGVVTTTVFSPAVKVTVNPVIGSFSWPDTKVAMVNTMAVNLRMAIETVFLTRRKEISKKSQ